MQQPPLPAQTATSALTPEKVQQISTARKLSKKIRHATAVATMDGWTTGIFAGLTLLCSLTSPVGLLLGAGMAGVSWFGFRGAKGLKILDPQAPRLLACNQMALGTMLFIYAGIQLISTMNSPAPLGSLAGADPQVAQLLKPYENITRTLYVAVYAAMMLVAIIAPGLTALYYHSRKGPINTYLQNTPAWILDLQRAGMTV